MSDEPPSWLTNTVTEDDARTIRNPADADERVKKFIKKKTAIVKRKQVAKVLEACGLSIVTSDKDPTMIVDEVLDTDDGDSAAMENWASGRAISETGRRKREAFVLEYLKDFNGQAAAVRIGHENGGGAAFNRYRRCAFTQNLIAHKLEKWEASTIVTREKVTALLWREANDYEFGTASSRVAAANKLAKVVGLDNDDININFNSIHNETYINAPLEVDEFANMKQVFDAEY